MEEANGTMRRTIDWSAAIWAGVIAGAVFLGGVRKSV